MLFLKDKALLLEDRVNILVHPFVKLLPMGFRNEFKSERKKKEKIREVINPMKKKTCVTSLVLLEIFQKAPASCG